MFTQIDQTTSKGWPYAGIRRQPVVSAAQAMTDYLTLMTGQPADVEEVKQAMAFAEVKCFHAPLKAMATKAKEDAAVAPKEPVVEVIKAKTNDEEADKALMQFLMDMGLIKLVD